MGFEQDFDVYVLSQAHGAASGPVVALIVHDEEYPEIDNAAVNVANFFKDGSKQASTTGIFDNKVGVGVVPYAITAWHTGAGSPWNQMCEGYENSGYAKQTREEWLDDYSSANLELLARHFAKRLRALGIPCRRISPSQLLNAINTKNPADGGICGHGDITVAAKIYGGHTDPGPQFPWDYFLGRVKFYYDGNIKPTTPPEDEMPLNDADKEWIKTTVRGLLVDSDDKWMGTLGNDTYVVNGTNAVHVTPVINPDGSINAGATSDKIQMLIALGFDNRGKQDGPISALLNP